MKTNQNQETTMEPYYYQKNGQDPTAASYSTMQRECWRVADENPVAHRIPAEELYEHIFPDCATIIRESCWVVSYRYRYYQDSPNIIFQYRSIC